MSVMVPRNLDYFPLEYQTSRPTRPCLTIYPKPPPEADLIVAQDPPPETEVIPPTSPHYHGHRDRLKKRLLDSQGEALADYEVLEAILFRALPRRDTKPIAKELLQRFGGFAEVIHASDGELRKIKYVKDGVIAEFALIKAATQRLLKTTVMNRPVLTSWIKVIDHCRAAMAFEPREQFRILFLDKRNRLILDEVQQTRHDRPHPRLRPRDLPARPRSQRNRYYSGP